MPVKANVPESETKPEAPDEPPKKEKADLKVTKSKGVPPGGDDAKAPTGSSAESPVPLIGKKKKGLGFPLFDDIANAFSKKE